MHRRLLLAALISMLAAGCMEGSNPCDPTILQPQIASLQMPDTAVAILGPRLAVSVGGTAIAIWRMSTSDTRGAYDEVYATEFQQGTWGTPRSVSRMALSGFVLTPPRVTINSNGRAVIGWIDGAGTSVIPVLRLARFDGSQWQPQVIDVLQGQIGPSFDIRLLDDDRLVVAYEGIDLPRQQVVLAISLGSVFTGSAGFGSSVASSSCQQTTDCTADGVALALRADGIGLIGWSQRTTLDPGASARAAPVDVNNQGMPIGPDVELSLAAIGSGSSTGEFAIAVHPSGTMAAAVQQLEVFPAVVEKIAGRIASDLQTSIGGGYAIQVQRTISMGTGRLLQFPRVAANRPGYAFFAWLSEPEQASTLEARIWLSNHLEPQDSDPAFTIDTSVVPGDQGRLGPHVAFSRGRGFFRRPFGTLVYAQSSAQNSNAVRWAQLTSPPWPCSPEWSLNGPVTIDSNLGQVTAIDLGTFSNDNPIAVWIRREAGQIVFRSAR